MRHLKKAIVVTLWAGFLLAVCLIPAGVVAIGLHFVDKFW